MKPRAVFLDRDGTVIEDRGYICHFSQAVVFPFAAEAIRLFNDHDYKVIVVTNQSSIARGICEEAQVEAIHHDLQREFLKLGARIDDFYYCPYHKDGIVEAYKKDHPWRKPAPGMLLQAAREHDLDLSRSVMIGDSARDIEAGRGANCRTVLVLTGHDSADKLAERQVFPDLVCQNLLAAAQSLIST